MGQIKASDKSGKRSAIQRATQPVAKKQHWFNKKLDQL